MFCVQRFFFIFRFYQFLQLILNYLTSSFVKGYSGCRGFQYFRHLLTSLGRKSYVLNQTPLGLIFRLKKDDCGCPKLNCRPDKTECLPECEVKAGGVKQVTGGFLGGSGPNRG